MSIITHKQHYVPQRYLSKWLNGTQFNVLNLKTKKKDNLELMQCVLIIITMN